MSYRQVIIARKSHLSIKENKVCIKQTNHENLIPLEDITIIVVDNNEVTFSAPFFYECAKHQITIMVCGKNHMPASITTSINQHYRPYQVVEYQIQQTQDMKDYVTEQVLKYKIKNQYRVISFINNNEKVKQLLQRYSEEIEGNDYINREATAAKVFFNSLYGSHYIRFEEDPINMGQNYGYGVLRSSIARSVNSYGLCSYIGVNHCGKTNPYNLIYDLIEPFRPIVDYYIASNIHLFTKDLTLQVRKELVNLLNATIIVNKKKVTVQYAIELLTKSYLRFIETGDFQLALPSIERINFDTLNEPI